MDGSNIHTPFFPVPALFNQQTKWVNFASLRVHFQHATPKSPTKHRITQFATVCRYIYIYISFSSFQKYPSPLTRNERTPAVTLHENSHTHTHFFLKKKKINAIFKNKQKKHVLQWGLGDRVPLLPLQRGKQEHPFVPFFFKAMQFPSNTCAQSPFS